MLVTLVYFYIRDLSEHVFIGKWGTEKNHCFPSSDGVKDIWRWCGCLITYKEMKSKGNNQSKGMKYIKKREKAYVIDNFVWFSAFSFIFGLCKCNSLLKRWLVNKALSIIIENTVEIQCILRQWVFN